MSWPVSEMTAREGEGRPGGGGATKLQSQRATKSDARLWAGASRWPVA